MGTTRISQVRLHPQHPERVWVVVEQPKGETRRLGYDPESETFHATGYLSLVHARGFGGVYGWIGGTGLPPGPHFDVLLFTDRHPVAGEILEGHTCGMFMRGDGDHKFVAVDDAWWARMAAPNLECLPPDAMDELRRLYPRVGEGEGWLDAAAATAYLRERQPERLRAEQ